MSSTAIPEETIMQGVDGNNVSQDVLTSPEGELKTSDVEVRDLLVLLLNEVRMLRLLVQMSVG